MLMFTHQSLCILSHSHVCTVLKFLSIKLNTSSFIIEPLLTQLVIQQSVFITATKKLSLKEQRSVNHDKIVTSAQLLTIYSHFA